MVQKVKRVFYGVQGAFIVFQPCGGQTNTEFAADGIGDYPTSQVSYVAQEGRLHATVYGGASPAAIPFCHGHFSAFT